MGGEEGAPGRPLCPGWEGRHGASSPRLALPATCSHAGRAASRRPNQGSAAEPGREHGAARRQPDERDSRGRVSGGRPVAADPQVPPRPAAEPAQPPPVGREAVTVRGGRPGASRSARHTQALQGHPHGGQRHGTAAAAEDVCRVRYSPAVGVPRVLQKPCQFVRYQWPQF